MDKRIDFYFIFVLRKTKMVKIKKMDYGWPDSKIATNHGPYTT